MNKLSGMKMKSHQGIIDSGRHYKNNVYPLKPEFRRYINTNIAKEKSESTAKSVLISMIVISIWCFAMVLLAKASHQFLQEICLKTVQKIELSRQ
ncbi:MAG: hypothetical protein WBF90_34820 [Rivularia sp. (in: cyanobacteria)]|jgi:hypothetical protein